MRVVVERDGGRAWDTVRGFLLADAVAHNVVASALAPSTAAAHLATWVEDGDDVVGVAVQVAATLPLNVTTMPAAAAYALAGALADAADGSAGLPGVRGEAGAAAAFAGAWAERTGVPATPVEGERLYALDALDEGAVTGVPGAERVATEDDVDVVAGFVAGFVADTGAEDPLGPPAQSAAALVASGRVVLWEAGEGEDDAVDGTPRSTAWSRAPTGGVGRVGRVYTPPEHRGRGYGGAVTAAVTRSVLDEGATPALLTQLANPTSNALYRRLGYRPTHERLHYRFG